MNRSPQVHEVVGRTPRNGEFFQCLDNPEFRASGFGASLGVHALLLLALMTLPLFVPPGLDLIHRATIPLAPPPERHAPVKYVAKETPKRIVSMESEAHQQMPVVKAVNIAAREEISLPRVLPEPKPVPIGLPEAIPKTAPPLTEPAPLIVTNLFSDAKSAAPAIVVPVRKAETAGFGERTGSGTTPFDRARNVASLSGFDKGVPGSAPQHLRPGTADAGFGAVTTADKIRTDVSPGGIETNHFDRPVEIIFKPRPEYTDEARKLRLEGEVLVEAVFTSLGEIHVTGVLKGLGHGLDESAVRAARQIRFKAAERQGKAVDSTAVIRIAFQLAY